MPKYQGNERQPYCSHSSRTEREVSSLIHGTFPCPVASRSAPFVPLVFRHHLAPNVPAAILETIAARCGPARNSAAFLWGPGFAVLRHNFGAICEACWPGAQPPCIGKRGLSGRGELS